MRVYASLLILVSQLTWAADQPNILVIWGDDVGMYNISSYNLGMMGYQTPNIDRIAKQGTMFTDYYGEQSCTAGRSAFITGQHPLRTGLTKVGTPGADQGIQDRDATLAELLKPLGYATGQFGKNHLGDRDEFLPTAHGFDEFYGNLYHLNAEEEPENPDYPMADQEFNAHYPGFKRQFTPRGVVRSSADGEIEDTGPLTRKRMETVDAEFVDAAVNFIDRSAKADKPFFVWFNSTRMHFRTHIDPKIEGQSGQGFYNDAMLEHDGHVGALLDKLDDLGIADNTIVIYSTDNGPHYNTWPDAAVTPFRGEKNTNWEGGFRVPAMIRWPGKVPAGRISNEVMSHLDWVPTLMAAAGDPDIKGKLLKGHQAGTKTFRVHLDGYDFTDYLTGKSEKGPRYQFFYFDDGGYPVATRIGDWKVVFAEQRARRFDVWREPFVVLRIPKLYNLRRDPFERADTDSNMYNEWWVDRVPWVLAGVTTTGQFLQTFREYPPSQVPDSWSVEQIMDALFRAAQQASPR